MADYLNYLILAIKFSLNFVAAHYPSNNRSLFYQRYTERRNKRNKLLKAKGIPLLRRDIPF